MQKISTSCESFGEEFQINNASPTRGQKTRKGFTFKQKNLATTPNTAAHCSDFRSVVKQCPVGYPTSGDSLSLQIACVRVSRSDATWSVDDSSNPKRTLKR
jgi:hypothetical protein